MNEFNFLGITIDKSLNWKAHVDKIATKISKVVGILNKLKNFLPGRVLMNIYNALIVPHFNYGALLWEKQINRIFILQKKAIRAVCNSKYNAHTNPLFRKLNTLKCQDICALHGYKFCFKLEKGMLPDYFQNSDIFVKSSRLHDYSMRCERLYIPSVRHDFAKSGIRYKIPKIFNDMEDYYKGKIYTHSFMGFKNYIKQKIISSYNLDCNIQNCYICNRL